MGGTYRNNNGTIENLSGGNVVDAALDKTSDHAISNAATATKFEEIDEAIGNTDISDIGDGTVTGGISQLNNDLSNKQSKTDNSLDTISKTVVGAINELNLNCAHSRFQWHTNANQYVLNKNETCFVIINATAGKIANNFPADSGGVLQVINIYGTHLIQYYTTVSDASMYVRRCANYPTSAEWTAWKKITYNT